MKSGVGSPPIALLAQGGRDWIAGRIYVCNLVRALKLLPDERRVPICVALPHSSRPADLIDLGIGPSTARYFAFRATDSLATKLRRTVRVSDAGDGHPAWKQLWCARESRHCSHA